MTKEWQSYAQLSAAQAPFDSYDSEYVGMSDEEELRRMAHNAANAMGTGEVLIEVPSEESIQEDLKELGLVDG